MDAALTSTFDYYSFLEKLTPKPEKNEWVCVVNESNQKVCYRDSIQNTVECDSSFCKVSMRTYDRKILNTNLPQGLWTNFNDNGAIPSIQIIGVIRKNELANLNARIGQLPMTIVPRIEEPYFGIPVKTKQQSLNATKCKFMPFLKSCRIGLPLPIQKV